MSGWLDLHNHVIPGVDDGARDSAEADAAIERLWEDGVQTIVATPHLDGSLTVRPEALDRRLSEIDAGWDALRHVLDGRDAPVVYRGAEVKLDVPEVDLSDPRVRLAGSSAVLVEFPFMSVPPRSAQVLSSIQRMGYVPLLAHPERYGGIDANLDVVRSWMDGGALLQVNAASLLGRYGRRAQETARELLVRGWVSCLASDYHARHSPQLEAARSLLEGWGGEEQARLLFETNPSRLIDDRPCEAVPQLRPRLPLGERIRKLLPW